MGVRPAVLADAPAIALAHIRAWQAAYRELLPADMLDGLDSNLERRTEWWAGVIADRAPDVVVAEREGAVVGFANIARCRDDDHGLLHRVGEVLSIYLREEAWGLGLGRDLMIESERLMVDRGFTSGCLWVLESNLRARRFYELAGWRADGTEKSETVPGASLHEVRYVKHL